MGRHLSPQYGHVIMVRGYPLLIAVNCLQHRCTISGCRLPHKPESVTFHIGCPVVRAGGRVGGWTNGHVTTKISWMDR